MIGSKPRGGGEELEKSMGGDGGGGRGESGQVEGSTQKEGEEVEMVEKKTGAAGEKKTTG